MKISVYATGGTIDKIYFDAKSEFEVGHPTAGDLLREANVVFDFELHSVLRKDSLEITDDDRRLVRSAIEADPCERVLVTHGTDTMVDTGRFLSGIPDKTIVLTGSMQPAGLRVTDAIFNVGFATAALQLLPHGVYLAMNGRVFDPHRCHKNVAENRFEAE